MATQLRVLIVEDSEDDALLVLRELERGGYDITSERVDTAKSMKSALEQAHWDLIVSDYNMPGFTGLGALKIMQEKGLDMPFILVSGIVGEDVAVAAMRAGSHDYIMKDNLKRLAPAVDRELRDAKVRHERRMGEKRLEYLNRVLRAIRNINQLIIREKDPNILIKKTCNELMGSRGYYNVWIAMLDESGKMIRAAEKGLGKDFQLIVDQLKRGDLPVCAKKALSQKEIVVIRDTFANCSNCSLSHKYFGRGGMAVRLEHNKRVYGLLVVSVPLEFIRSQEELSLLKELSEDISFALYNIEMGEKRNRAEQEKEKMQKQFLQAQKMEAIGQLTGGIAHDFNNLLTAIQGYTYFAMNKIDEADPAYHDLKEVEQASIRAADLVQQLLLFSRKQSMRLDLLDINKVIVGLMKMINRIIGEDIKVHTKLEPSICNVLADKGNIDQIIMNISVNARDAMPNGGDLTIKTENITLDQDQCTSISEALPGSYVCLSLTDTGIGMDKDVIRQIFNPFFTTKGVGKGTGLGLSVVYGIVRQHKGWINIHSVPGEGSIFKIYLPTASETEDRQGDADENSLEVFQGSGERILLIEDDVSVRHLAMTAISENGYKVFEAENAKKALEIFKKEKGNFHLVISDVVLPDQDGVHLVEKLISIKPKIRVILNSGYTDDKSQWDTIRKRKFRFLQKPYKMPELLKAIKDEIDSK